MCIFFSCGFLDKYPFEVEQSLPKESGHGLLSLFNAKGLKVFLFPYRLFNGLNGVKIENQGKQSLLTFFNVSEEDYGNYTCVAMNIMGISNASIILYGKYRIETCGEGGLVLVRY